MSHIYYIYLILTWTCHLDLLSLTSLSSKKKYVMICPLLSVGVKIKFLKVYESSLKKFWRTTFGDKVWPWNLSKFNYIKLHSYPLDMWFKNWAFDWDILPLCLNTKTCMAILVQSGWVSILNVLKVGKKASKKLKEGRPWARVKDRLSFRKI